MYTIHYLKGFVKSFFFKQITHQISGFRYKIQRMITKSDFIKHEECPIWLWLVKYRKDLLPKQSEALTRIFTNGNLIDELARKLYPEGIEIEDRFERGYINTKRMIEEGATVMFQPTAITNDGLGCTADILTKDLKMGLWDLREVKSSTSVKEEHLVDVAFQKICFERAGIKIGRTYLIHINNEYVRQGEIEPEKLFVEEEITEQVAEHMDEARKQIEEAKLIIGNIRSPDMALIQKCHNPEKCDWLDFYIHGFPEIYEIAETFPDDHLKILLDRGTLDYTRLPQQLLDRVGFVEPVAFEEIDREGIKKELADLVYPLYFFDYETYSAGIPPFDGTKPYQQIPFQYSLDIMDEPGGEIIHKEFLARSFVNPMAELIENLKKDFGPKGSVVVWNASFETLRNKEMAEMFPEEAEFLLDLNERMFDLMLLFKFDRKIYIHSEFNKSASLKKVLPVLCPELAYTDLEIQEGGTASASWPVMTNEETPEEEKGNLARAMLAYCGRDTMAMVGIFRKCIF